MRVAPIGCAVAPIGCAVAPVGFAVAPVGCAVAPIVPVAVAVGFAGEDASSITDACVVESVIDTQHSRHTGQLQDTDHSTISQVTELEEVQRGGGGRRHATRRHSPLS